MAVPAHDERDFAFARSARASRARRDPAAGRRHAGRRHHDQRPTPARGVMVNSGPFDGERTPDSIVEGGRLAARRKAAARPPSRSGCATGCSAASGTGAPRSPSCTARRAARSPSPTTSCRSCCPTTSTSSPAASPRWRATPRGRTWRARGAVARPCATRTPWTRSSTPLGTSSATARRATTRWSVPARGRGAVDAGGAVHGRRGARDPAPDVLALLHEGPLRHGHGRVHRSRSRG